MTPRFIPDDTQLMAGALCPKFTAIASVVGSSLIIRDVIEKRKNRSDALTTRHRLMVGMSVCDILSSSAWFLTSWPVPEDLRFAVWNVGTTQTCSAQGFFVQLGIGTVLYNACLALYYLLVIRYGWKSDYIAKRVESWMHFVAVGFALSTSVAGLALDFFNPVGNFCIIAPYPPLCTQSYENKGPTNCIRGDNTHIYLVAFWLGPACCITVFLAVSMFLVYCKIRTTEGGSSHLQSQPGRLQRRFASQALLYVGAMFTTWGPLMGLYIHREVTSKPPNWWIMFCSIFIVPAQGFFNALIYFHSAREQQPRRSTSTAEHAPPSSSFFVPPSFQLWGSFRRLLPGRRSAVRTESIAAAGANDVMAEEEELQDSGDEDPVAEPVDSFKQDIENCPGPLLL